MVSRTITKFIVVRYLLWRLNDWFITFAWETRGEISLDNKQTKLAIFPHFHSKTENCVRHVIILSVYVPRLLGKQLLSETIFFFCIFRMNKETLNVFIWTYSVISENGFFWRRFPVEKSVHIFFCFQPVCLTDNDNEIYIFSWNGNKYVDWGIENWMVS